MRKTRAKTVDRITAALHSSQSFCLCSHMRPDGDCVGSMMGLALALLEKGKEVACWNQDPMPQKLQFLDPDGLIRKPETVGRKFDCVITLDSASLERLGTICDHIHDRNLMINIDHHTSNTRYADINWIAEREPSTGELVFKLLKETGWPITPRIADCLFTAISTDTGSFQYPTTQPETYFAAGELVEKGANLATICDEVYQSYSLSRVKLLRRIYNKFRLTHDNQIAYFWLKQEDYVRTGADTTDSEGLIDHIRAIAPVEVACVFEELEPELIRVSLRSKNSRVNVSDIAGIFGGGGHKAAAGVRIPGRPLTIQRKVVAAIKKALDANSE